MELKNRKVGIVSLGWLGESLADHLLSKGAEIWGTVSAKEKSDRLRSSSHVDAILWKNENGFSEELKTKLHTTDILVLNLPPSVFKGRSYASGLTQFLPYLGKQTKVIFTSSTSAYPNHVVDAVESQIIAKSEFNKINEAENQLSSNLKDQLCILRLAGLVGEDRNPVHYLVKKELNDFPDKPVNLIHRKDILQVIERVIEQDFFGEILNLCNPSHPTRKEYYTRKAMELNLPIPRFKQTVLDEDEKVVNCDKLIKKLSYNKFTDL